MKWAKRFFRLAIYSFRLFFHAATFLLAFLMIKLIRFYQIAVSPLLGKNCRFTPTCSQYFIMAVEKYGPVRGALKGIWRILRCHPFSKGGEDYP